MPLNPRNGRDELDRIIDLTAPSIVIFDADCDEKFGAVVGHLLAGKNGETAARANTHMAALLASNAD